MTTSIRTGVEMEKRGAAPCDTVDVIRSERGAHYGTCEDEKIGGDAEAAAREGGVEAADEEGCLRTATAFT